jgi:YfiH family protein
MSAASHPALLRADWPAPAQVHACTTLRRGGGIGASSAPFDAFNLGARRDDDAGAVQRNRETLRAVAGLPAQPRWLQQVHGIDVVRFGADARRDVAAPDDEPLADAAVTAERGVVLAILTADCLPVLFCAADGSEIGAAHAGWRGLAAGVLEATVAALHTAPQDLLAWFGPAAGPSTYEVGDEVRQAFVQHDAAAAAEFVATRAGHWHADLYALARRRLAAVGVTRVSGGGLCTISDAQRFYSHRRDARTGRMATLIWRE